MKIPSKPGTYYFRNAKSGWCLVDVPDEVYVECGGHYYTHEEWAATRSGEFHNIIPSNDQLTAMREAIRKADALYADQRECDKSIDDVCIAYEAARAKVEMEEGT